MTRIVASADLRCAMVVRLSVTCPGLSRQYDREGRTLAKFAPHVDRSAERGDDLPADPETQSEAAATMIGRQPFESCEQALHHVRRDTDPAVADVDARAIAVERDGDVHR